MSNLTIPSRRWYCFTCRAVRQTPAHDPLTPACCGKLMNYIREVKP